MKRRTIKYLNKKNWSKKYTPSREYIIPGLQDKLDAAFFLGEFEKLETTRLTEDIADWANKNSGGLGRFAAQGGEEIGFIPAPGVVPMYIWNNSIKARRGGWETSGYKRIVKPPIIVHWIPMDGVDNNDQVI